MFSSLADFVKRANPGKQPDGKVWVENPSLHLTALYYMQEQRRRPGCETEPAMKEMQEEIASNFTKGTYIVALQKEGKGVPLVKLGEEQLFWPLFTDVLEFQKFNKENSMKPMVIKGIVFNPLGVNMPLTITKTQRPAANGTDPAGAAEPGKMPGSDAAGPEVSGSLPKGE